MVSVGSRGLSGTSKLGGLGLSRLTPRKSVYSDVGQDVGQDFDDINAWFVCSG